MKLDYTSLIDQFEKSLIDKKFKIDLGYKKISYKNLETIIKLNKKNHLQKKIKFLPLDNLNSQEEKLESLKAFKKTLNEGEFTSGKFIEIFETQLKEIYNCKNIIATCSGTMALQISLVASNVGHGDEVLVPVNSFAATENAVHSVGAKPIFIDVDESFNMNPKIIKKNITSKTKAIIPVCLYGSIKNIQEICKIAKKNNLISIVDAAQAFGIASIIKQSDFVILSFNPFKNFGGMGKSGAILTKHKKMYNDLIAITYHGFNKLKKNHKKLDWGFNGKIDNIQAAILSAKMKYWPINSLKRAFLARRYIDKISEISKDLYTVPKFTKFNTWHLFPLLIEKNKKNKLIKFLKKKGIETDLYYPKLSFEHNTKYSKKFKKKNFYNAIKLKKKLLHLPIYNKFSLHEQDKVIRALNLFYNTL